MEAALAETSRWVAAIIDALAVLVVTYASIESFVRLIGLVTKPPVVFGARKAVWRRFGSWLVLGLEFALAADIVRSVISPTWTDIGKLASIAVIRTFLNYFLESDLDQSGRPAEA